MDSQDKQIEDLKAQVAALLKRVAELELSLAKAQKDSSTSSKPPSSDIAKPKKKRKPGRPRKPRRGGQPDRITHPISFVSAPRTTKIKNTIKNTIKIKSNRSRAKPVNGYRLPITSRIPEIVPSTH